MKSSKIAKANPARELLSTVIYKASRGVSKRDLNIVINEYGDYLKVMECDSRLIKEAVNENSRKTLVAALEELHQWFWKMDNIEA